MQINKKRILWVLVFILLFSSGIAGGFIYFSKSFGIKQPTEATPQAEKQEGDSSFVRVYYPSEGRLIMEERRVKRQESITAIAGAIIEEFLRGPANTTNTGKTDIPMGTKLLGIYSGSDGILYVDLSDEFRRNFQGDVLTEFLLLKGIYESIISNVTGIDDVKVIIEGREIESIGGHLPALYPLKNTLTEVK